MPASAVSAAGCRAGARVRRAAGHRLGGQRAQRVLPGGVGPVAGRVPGVVRGGGQRQLRGGGLLHARRQQHRRAGGHLGVAPGVGAEEEPVGGRVVDRVVVHGHQRVAEERGGVGGLIGRDPARDHPHPAPGHLDGPGQRGGQRGAVGAAALLVELGRHDRERGQVLVLVDQPLLHGRGQPGLRLGGGGRAGAEGVLVGRAVPLVVADIVELQLEGAETQVAHRRQLVHQRVHVLARAVAEALAGGDRVAERHVVGLGPLGQRAQVALLRGGVGVAPQVLAVRVVPRGVEVEVLLGPAQEVDQVEALGGGPRRAVEALGGAAHRRPGGPVTQRQAGEAVAALALALVSGDGGEQLAQALHGVEGAGGVHAYQHHRTVAAAGGGQLTGRQRVAAVRQSVRGAAAEGLEHLGGGRVGLLLRAADVDHQRARCGGGGGGQRGGQGGGARLDQHLAQRRQRARVRLGSRHKGHLGGHRHRLAGQPELLRPGKDLRVGQAAQRGAHRSAADRVG